LYCIVYDDYTDSENGFDPQNGDMWHYLKLRVDSDNPRGNEAPEKISGSFRLWDKIGTFGALVRDEGEKANYWDMEKVEWSDIPEDDEDPAPTPVHEDDEIEKRQPFGHGITVLKTLDDREFPFIELIYNMGPDKTDGGGDLIIKTLGKKQRHDKSRFGLTDNEAQRLMEDGVVEELQGMGWEDLDDSEDESDGQGPTSPAANQSEPTVDVAGTKRKAEDPADDSERRPVSRID
jgi:hypothetical protein